MQQIVLTGVLEKCECARLASLEHRDDVLELLKKDEKITPLVRNIMEYIILSPFPLSDA